MKTKIDEPICYECDGSGEGYNEGTTCCKCHGSGTMTEEYYDSDYEYDFFNNMQDAA